VNLDRFFELIVSLVRNLDYKTISMDKSLSENKINTLRSEPEEFGYSLGIKK
jgi:hypothetical protein